MATNPDDQVTINMDNLNPSNGKPDAVNTAIDGRRSGHRRHGSHGSGSGSHHHSYYSGESDTEDTHHSRHNHSHSRRRSRSRSRSRSPSPGRSNNRGKRDVNVITTIFLSTLRKLLIKFLFSIVYRCQQQKMTLDQTYTMLNHC